MIFNPWCEVDIGAFGKYSFMGWKSDGFRRPVLGSALR